MSDLDKKKKIVFIAEGNNELDHYLPIISKLEGQATIVFNPSIEVVLTNEVHKHICEKYNVKKLSLISFFNVGILTHGFRLVHCVVRRIYSSLQFKLVRKAFIFSLQLYRGSLKLSVNKEKVQQSFKEYDWSIIDVKVLDLDGEGNSLTLFLKSLESLGLKNLMISHGLTINFKPSSLTEIKNFFKPVMMCCCNSREIAGFQLQLPGVTINPLGDLRYDIEYLNLLNEVHYQLPKLEEKYTNRNSILYLVGNIPGNEGDQVHRDIINSCLKEFEYVVVKLHPRNPYFLTEFLDNSRVIQATNNIDTSRLIEEHEWVITAFSGIIMHAALQKKKSIIYRPDYLKDREMIFDTSDLFKAFSIQELKNLKSIYKDEREKVLDFYTEYYSAGSKESIVDRHLKVLETN